MSKKTVRISLTALACSSAAIIIVGSLCLGGKVRGAIASVPDRDVPSERVRETPFATKAGIHALTDDIGNAPILFVPAKGQFEARIGFYVMGANKTVSFDAEGLTFSMRRPAPAQGKAGSEQAVVKLGFLGARQDVVPEGLERADAGLSGPRGAAKAGETGAPGCSKIIYRDLWPGIDIVYKGGQDKLNCEFIVHPGADPSQIQLVYRGVGAIALTKEGRLALRAPAGDFEEDVPAGYQEIEGRRKGVAVTFSLEDRALGQGSQDGPDPERASLSRSNGPVLAVGFEVGSYDRSRTLVLDTAGGYFGRKTGTTSIEVTGGHAGGSEFNLPTGQWIARMGILGYMQNAPANGTLAIYKDTATPDVKQYVCHTVTGPLPVGAANKAWTVLEVASGPVWLEPGDYWILRNNSGDWSNKFVISGEEMSSNKWGWCYIDYPNWPESTRDRTWVENFSNVEGCLYAEWDGGAPGPSLTSLVPESANAGDPGFLLSAIGSGFAAGAVVRWGGSPRTTTFVSSTELDAEIAAADLTSGKTVQVTVQNPNDGVSSPLPFAIHNPLPSLTALSPTRMTGGGDDFTLTAMGSNFVPNSVVRWNGSGRITTFIGSGELQAAIPATDLATGGQAQVTVYNPAPSGGATAALTVDVSTYALMPTPSSATVTAGQPAAYEIQLTPQYGPFPSPVAFSCSNLPSNCTASFSPDSVTPGAGSVSTTMTLTTKAESSPSVLMGTAGPALPAAGLIMLVATLLPAVVGRGHSRSRTSRCLVAACTIFCLMFLTWSCGSNPAPNGTPKGTHRVTVKGTSGTMTVSTTVTLIVN